VFQNPVRDGGRVIVVVTGGATPASVSHVRPAKWYLARPRSHAAFTLEFCSKK